MSNRAAFSRPDSRQAATVLAAVKAKPSVAAETRPALTAAARGGADDPRSGRENGSAGVEQENMV